MNGDQTDDNGVDPGGRTTAPGQAVEGSGSDRRTVILRISGQANPETLIPEIIETGAKVVSEGAGVIIIEGTPEEVDQLRGHKWIVAVEEPRQFQMRPPGF